MISQERVTHIYERNAPVYDLMESPLEWLAARPMPSSDPSASETSDRKPSKRSGPSA